MLPERPAAVSLKLNFSTKKVGVQVRKIVATKFAQRKTAINSNAAGVRKMTRAASLTDNAPEFGTVSALRSAWPRCGSRNRL